MDDHQKFTQKERDIETGLDYFIHRYYAPTQGRFTSLDVPFADQWEADPQSWNLYTYVGNSPTNATDPLGLWKRLIAIMAANAGKRRTATLGSRSRRQPDTRKKD